MKGVLLDINVLLDVFLARSEWLADSATAVQAGLDGRVSAQISAASLPTILDLVRRNADPARARAFVKECLKSLRILPVDREALELSGGDAGVRLRGQFARRLRPTGPARCHRDSRFTRLLGFPCSSPLTVGIPGSTPARRPGRPGRGSGGG